MTPQMLKIVHLANHLFQNCLFEIFSRSTVGGVGDCDTEQDEVGFWRVQFLSALLAHLK